MSDISASETIRTPRLKDFWLIVALQGAQMRQKFGTTDPSSAEQLVKDIRRATRRRFSAEEKIRIVLDGLRGEAAIAELCRREGIAESLYYSWSKVFLEAGKRREIRHAQGVASRRIYQESHDGETRWNRWYRRWW
jgi:transposase-like protein